MIGESARTHFERSRRQLLIDSGETSATVSGSMRHKDASVTEQTYFKPKGVKGAASKVADIIRGAPAGADWVQNAKPWKQKAFRLPCRRPPRAVMFEYK
jgi:hypothetical protein